MEWLGSRENVWEVPRDPHAQTKPRSSKFQNAKYSLAKTKNLHTSFGLCFSSHIPIPDLSDTSGGSQCKTLPICSTHLSVSQLLLYSMLAMYFQIPDCNPLLGVFICTLLPCFLFSTQLSK